MNNEELKRNMVYDDKRSFFRYMIMMKIIVLLGGKERGSPKYGK